MKIKDEILKSDIQREKEKIAMDFVRINDTRNRIKKRRENITELTKRLNNE